MRISDWSADVCSSDLDNHGTLPPQKNGGMGAETLAYLQSLIGSVDGRPDLLYKDRSLFQVKAIPCITKLSSRSSSYVKLVTARNARRGSNAAIRDADDRFHAVYLRTKDSERNTRTEKTQVGKKYD